MTTPYPPRGMASILGSDRAIVAMIHLQPLPGSPRAALSPREIARHAVEEARVLAAAGFDAILLENMHDAPYLMRDVGAEAIAAFTRAACEVRAAVDVLIGVERRADGARRIVSLHHLDRSGPARLVEIVRDGAVVRTAP